MVRTRFLCCRRDPAFPRGADASALRHVRPRWAAPACAVVLRCAVRSAFERAAGRHECLGRRARGSSADGWGQHAAQSKHRQTVRPEIRGEEPSCGEIRDKPAVRAWPSRARWTPYIRRPPPDLSQGRTPGTDTFRRSRRRPAGCCAVRLARTSGPIPGKLSDRSDRRRRPRGVERGAANERVDRTGSTRGPRVGAVFAPRPAGFEVRVDPPRCRDSDLPVRSTGGADRPRAARAVSLRACVRGRRPGKDHREARRQDVRRCDGRLTPARRALAGRRNARRDSPRFGEFGEETTCWMR